jgi:hypothetical protein
MFVTVFTAARNRSGPEPDEYSKDPSILFVIIHLILWYVHPLLGNDLDMSSYKTAVAR